MPAILKDTRFWIGTGVGYLLLPYLTKNLMPLVGKVTGKGGDS